MDEDEYIFDEEEFLKYFERDLKACFEVPTLLGMWPHIDSAIQQLGLNHPAMCDTERIAMYDWIVQNYHKYIFSKQTKLLAHVNDLHQLEADIVEIISKAPDAIVWVDDNGKRTTKEEGHASVKHLVYMALRDQWLREVHDLIEAGLNMIERSEENGS